MTQRYARTPAFPETYSIEFSFCWHNDKEYGTFKFGNYYSCRDDDAAYRLASELIEEEMSRLDNPSFAYGNITAHKILTNSVHEMLVRGKELMPKEEREWRVPLSVAVTENEPVEKKKSKRGKKKE